MKTLVYRFPVLGRNRETKWALEHYWAGKISLPEFQSKIREIVRDRARFLASFQGIDGLPVSDFFLYDFILDVAFSTGVIPARFHRLRDTAGHWMDLYFTLARGKEGVAPLELTKWFNTNYHYLVPEFNLDAMVEPNFQALEELYAPAIEEIPEARRIAVVPGPFTFLTLSKTTDNLPFWETPAPQRERILRWWLPRYVEWLKRMGAYVRGIFLEEPALVYENSSKFSREIQALYEQIVGELRSSSGKENAVPLYVMVYYEAPALSGNVLWSLPVQGIGLDFVDGFHTSIQWVDAYPPPEGKYIVAGIVPGRHPFRVGVQDYRAQIHRIHQRIDPSRVIWTHSCPLLHLPYTVEDENEMDPGVRNMLAFAMERLKELEWVPEMVRERTFSFPEVSVPETQMRPDIREKVERLRADEKGRSVPFSTRYPLQCRRLGLPMFPGTTIGSFPQTAEVRRVRFRWKKGEISREEYEKFIQEQIANCIRIQEEIGLDVLVHGEFERSDMVEFFALQMDGMITTSKGWVQSYGSRAVRPPIIWGDVSWRQPMTIREIAYAQGLTERPVKGMLTGPVTIVQWSFVRPDISREEVVYQVAVALRQEIDELLKAGIRVIQIDEPALVEAMPLKESQWMKYKEWAVRAFHMTHSFIPPDVQIHTHMCYSEFGRIYDAVVQMDADVLLIEASRSRGQVIDEFRDYPNAIGPGVYDIHSPRIPQEEEIEQILRKALSVLPPDRIWVNPDCGLKTRRWEEVIPSLNNMMQVTRKLRQEYASPV